MEKENIKTEGEPIFPEESSLIVEKILEKYGLIKNRDELINKISDLYKDSKIKPEERIKVLENLPNAKLARLVTEYSYGKISFEKITSRIEKDFNITKEMAKKMAEELKATLLDLIKPAKLTKTNKGVASSDIKNIKSQPKNKPSINLPVEKTGSSQEDTYRESIE